MVNDHGVVVTRNSIGGEQIEKTFYRRAHYHRLSWPVDEHYKQQHGQPIWAASNHARAFGIYFNNSLCSASFASRNSYCLCEATRQKRSDQIRFLRIRIYVSRRCWTSDLLHHPEN